LPPAARAVPRECHIASLSSMLPWLGCHNSSALFFLGHSALTVVVVIVDAVLKRRRERRTTTSRSRITSTTTSSTTSGRHSHGHGRRLTPAGTRIGSARMASADPGDAHAASLTRPQGRGLRRLGAPLVAALVFADLGSSVYYAPGVLWQ